VTATNKQAREVWALVFTGDAELGAHLRESVHDVWPTLASTLDYPELEVNVGDVWHGEDGLEDMMRRQSVREAWPELGYALDYNESPTWDLSEEPVTDDQPAGQPVEIVLMWPRPVALALAILCGVAIGMWIEFALLAPGIAL
jgi:hypothetical protein